MDHVFALDKILIAFLLGADISQVPRATISSASRNQLVLRGEREAAALVENSVDVNNNFCWKRCNATDGH